MIRLTACVAVLSLGLVDAGPARAQFSPFADYDNYVFCEMGAASESNPNEIAHDAPVRLMTDIFENDESLKIYSGVGNRSFDPFWQDFAERIERAGYPRSMAIMCKGFVSRAEADTNYTQQRTHIAERGHDLVDVGWPVGSKAGNPSTDTKRSTVYFRSGDYYANPSRAGYEAASIEVAHKFIVCAGEIHFAYSLDKQSLRHSAGYVLDRDASPESYRTVVPDSAPPAPETFPLDAIISRTNPAIQVAEVKDAIAGEALGMGCFTGQTKNLGTVAQLVGPNATPPQIKAYLDSLWVERIANIPFALRHPKPIDPAVRAEREARERAEREAGEAQRRTELRTEAERIYREITAGGAEPYVSVNSELFPVLQQVIAENTARQNAEYQAQMAAAREGDRRYEAEVAAHRAAVAESERQQAEWRAEVCRTDSARCP